MCDSLIHRFVPDDDRYNYYLGKIVFGNGILVVIALPILPNLPPGKIFTSLDQGITWKETYVLKGLYWDDDVQYWDITFGNGVFVLVLGWEEKIIYSRDGFHWKEAVSVPTNPLFTVAYGNGYFLSMGEDLIFYSKNGVEWKEIPLNASSKRFLRPRSLFIGKNEIMVLDIVRQNDKNRRVAFISPFTLHHDEPYLDWVLQETGNHFFCDK